MEQIISEVLCCVHCEYNLINFFGIFTMFLVAYGFKLRIWEASQTTKYVIIFAFLLSVLIPQIDFNIIIGLTVLFLSWLFLLAIWRKKDFI